MTDLSRRGILGAAFFGVVLAPFVRGTEAEAARRTNLYSRRRFSPLRGRRFHLVDGGRRTPVRLVRISNLPGSPKGHNGCFALEFKATKAGPPQGTYTLRRQGFRATTLFVVPDERHRTYRAIVNRAH
jgi:hypothetical protein